MFDMNDDDELFLWSGWPTKGVKPYFQPGPLLEILTIPNLRQATSRIWTCAETQFRLYWMKLCSSDTTTPRRYYNAEKYYHRIIYVRIQVFTDLYSPIISHILWSVPEDSEAYLEPCKTTFMELSAKTFNC